VESPRRLYTKAGCAGGRLKESHELIYSVLDERFANGKLTTFTTNAAGMELQRRWGPEYGPYLVRRIREFCVAQKWSNS
jgi:hypothetical protein